MGGVQQHHLNEVCRCGGGDDLSPEAQFDQFGKHPGMIDVGVRQKDAVDGCGVEGKGRPVPFRVLPLMHSTVHEKLDVSECHMIAGTGYLPGCAKKLYLHVCHLR